MKAKISQCLILIRPFQNKPPIKSLDEKVQKITVSQTDSEDEFPLDSSVLRTKTSTSSKSKYTDEEVVEELKMIVHPGDPTERFKMKQEIGAG